MAKLETLSALGKALPSTSRIGDITIVENVSLSIATVTLTGSERDIGRLAKSTRVLSSFESRPGQRLVFGVYDPAFPLLLNEDYNAKAFITDQTDAWVVFDVVAPLRFLEKICNIDHRQLNEGMSIRTLIEYMPCFVVRIDGLVRILGERSTAKSLHHILEKAASRFEA